MFDNLINELKIIEEKENQKEEIVNGRLNYLENENEKLRKQIDTVKHLTDKQHRFIEELYCLVQNYHLE